MRKAVALAGIDRNFCFHALRHTYASALVRRGATLNTIADQLGHVNTVQVMRTYGHLAPCSRASEIRQLAPSIDDGVAVSASHQAEALRQIRAKFTGEHV